MYERRISIVLFFLGITFGYSLFLDVIGNLKKVVLIFFLQKKQVPFRILIFINI